MLAWLSVWGETQICICPANATATHYILLQKIQIAFTFMVYLSGTGTVQGGRKTVVVVVAAVQIFVVIK